MDKTYLHTIWRDITSLKHYQNELLIHQSNLEKMVEDRTIELQTTNKNLNIQKAQLEKTMENLKATQTQLAHSEKMASLGVLTAGVAHEINNPLNYIMGGYEGLKVHIEKVGYDNEQIPMLLNAIKIGVERATKIIIGLNQFSRDNENKDESCDIHSILDNCLLMLNNQFGDGIQIVKKFNTESIVVSGNVGQLHQAFINIISNANQAIQTKGKITISTNIVDNNATIEISDTGLGISKENLQKITEPFFTTKAPSKGTGLGLSICYAIIKEHNGLLEFESEIGKGTKARIVLPISTN